MFRRYESLEDIVQPVAPDGTYQASAADRLSCVTIPSLTAYSTLLHALQVRNEGSQYAMMAPMVEDVCIKDAKTYSSDGTRTSTRSSYSCVVTKWISLRRSVSNY